jgi:branched-chain amino acid transport system permease protein
METNAKLTPGPRSASARERLGRFYAPVPLLAWLLGGLAAVSVEHLAGDSLAEGLGLPKIPGLFGILFIFKEIKHFLWQSWDQVLALKQVLAGEGLAWAFSLPDPFLTPRALVYLVLVYVIPLGLLTRLIAPAANRLAAALLNIPFAVAVAIYLGLLYASLHLWADLSAYRVITLKLTLIAVILTLSLNVINGYMGEFSCSHPGFMSLGAYGASVFTLVLFANDRIYGKALLPDILGPFLFPLALVAGGMLAALGALVVAVPSFRTRGDYLAIISLAFMFIVKSLVENLEVIGGPRGLSSQPNYASLPTVFIWTVLCVWTINNFVRSTLGKALNTVRDDETAAEAMTINTRHTKITAFLFAAFWAGVAGGLFAHVIRYINPGTFGLTKLAEVLAMVYFGGLNSVYGSIFGAVSLSLLSEALRPLEIFKWIIIPLMLILVMIYRPKGLIAFKEFDMHKVIQPRGKG